MKPLPISPKSLRRAVALIQTFVPQANCEGRSIVAEFEQALRGSPKKKLARKVNSAAKRASRQLKNWNTAEIRRQVVNRADFHCECGCGFWLQFDAGQLDHFWGRGKVRQSVKNTWLLAAHCHRAKTNNEPSATHWLAAYAAHSEKNGHVDEWRKASDRLAFVLRRAG